MCGVKEKITLFRELFYAKKPKHELVQVDEKNDKYNRKKNPKVKTSSRILPIMSTNIKIPSTSRHEDASALSGTNTPHGAKYRSGANSPGSSVDDSAEKTELSRNASP